MRVCEQDELDRQTFARSSTKHLRAIATSVESRCFAFRGIPDKKGIYGHVAVVCVEVREAREVGDFLWDPFVRGELREGIRVEVEQRRDTLDGFVVEPAI